jgi:hypothetical protein
MAWANANAGVSQHQLHLNPSCGLLLVKLFTDASQQESNAINNLFGTPRVFGVDCLQYVTAIDPIVLDSNDVDAWVLGA